jgi:LysM repeat protein
MLVFVLSLISCLSEDHECLYQENTNGEREICGKKKGRNIECQIGIAYCCDMTFSGKQFLGIAMLAGLLGLTACTLTGESQVDEEKEPHFLDGKERVNSLDYAGAIDSFEKALQVNPRSASAHFELACLCDQREADPAAAIYHYNHYLKLRPNGEDAERARNRITACKQELARAVSLGPVTQNLQRDFEQLTEQNKRLMEDNKTLRDELERWKAAAAGRQPEPASQAAALANTPRVTQVASASTPAAGSNTDASNGLRTARSNAVLAGMKTHTVRARETPAAIARKYGIRVDALMSANPRLDARRMQIGQTLAIPAP